jgi:hypothetical protein
MKHHVTFGIVLGALLVTLAGCKDSPLGPSKDSPAGPPNKDSPRLPFPEPLPNTAGIYDRISGSFIPGSSRYVLYGDGTFSLQYVRPDWGFFEYPGRYSRSGSLFTFDFDGSNTAGSWLADGILRGDSLIVKYNIVMQLADFEDGVYLRTIEAASK